MPHVAPLQGANRMPASGSSIFTDAEGYQASLELIDLVVPEPRAFQARLTWLDLPNLHVLRAQESSGRVGILRPPADRVFIGFPTRPGSALVVDGAEMGFGKAVMHAPNETIYHRTTSACEWGAVSLTPASLRTFGRIIVGQELQPPTTGQILHLATKPRQRLLSLHRQAARLAETHLTRVIHPEVAHALEQDLIAALIGAIGSRGRSAILSLDRAAAGYIQRYEMMAAEHFWKPLRMKDVCAALDVSEHTFRARCAEVLGMSPNHYRRLRRLKYVRGELLRAGASADSVRAVLARCGFGGIHRFFAEYWITYGEIPPLPPRTSDMSDPHAPRRERGPSHQKSSDFA
jgi:AraC-like DNA-binding protein